MYMKNKIYNIINKYFFNKFFNYIGARERVKNKNKIKCYLSSINFDIQIPPLQELRVCYLSGEEILFLQLYFLYVCTIKCNKFL